MEGKRCLRSCKRGGEIIDGSFGGKELIVLDPPGKKKIHARWLKLIIKGAILWTGVRC